MQGMKLKERIARCVMPCRQHETLLRVRRDGQQTVVLDILPLGRAGFQPFVTFVHLRGIFSVNSANTQRSRRFKAFRTAGSAEKCLVWPNRINSIAAVIECPIWLVGQTIFMPNKIALITGCSNGFGLLTSVELAKAGYRVVATMRELSRRTKLDQAVVDAGVADKIDVRALDVTHFSEIAAFVDTIVRDYGRIDVLVNNAGFAMAGFAEDIKLEELRTQFETNFFGAVAMTKAVLPIMRKQRSGYIIQISSIVGLQGSITVSSYSASKHALEGWSESLRLEVDALGIKVVLVEPGAFDTGVWTEGARMARKQRKMPHRTSSAACACAR